MKIRKVHIKHVIFLEFKYNKTATETANKASRVYGQGLFTEFRVWNWFQRFLLVNLEQDTRQTSIKKL